MVLAPYYSNISRMLEGIKASPTFTNVALLSSEMNENTNEVKFTLEIEWEAAQKVKLSTREAALLGLLLVLGGVFLTNHYIFQPLITHKQQLVLENNNLTLELQALQNRISKCQSIERDNRKSRDDYQSMLEALPQSSMIPSIIDYLELIARGGPC